MEGRGKAEVRARAAEGEGRAVAEDRGGRRKIEWSCGVRRGQDGERRDGTEVRGRGERKEGSGAMGERAGEEVIMGEGGERGGGGGVARGGERGGRLWRTKEAGDRGREEQQRRGLGVA
eukprot:1126867-Rhodomonas_salina.1